MTSKISGSQTADRRFSPGHHRHHPWKIKATKALLNVPSFAGDVDTDAEVDRNFISARYNDNYNVFDRSWISTLEEDDVI